MTADSPGSNTMDRFEQAVGEMKNQIDLKDVADERTEAGDSCPDGRCDKTLFKLSHPRSGDSEIPPNPEAPEEELVCIHHGIQVAR